MEGPYKLPKGWRWVRLGEVCEHIRQSIDPRRYPAESFSLYSIPAYDAGRQPVEAKGSEIGSAKLRVSTGLCLFSKLNPRIPRVWVLEAVPDTGTPVASTEFMPLAPHTSVLDIKYLGQALLSREFLQQVRRDVTGATGSRQRLKPEVVLSALIPLPPLDEQRRIVARIEAIMERIREARRLREQAHQDANRLWQSVLANTFPHPGSELPPDWRWMRLGEIFELQQGASMSPHRRIGRNPRPFLRTKNVLWGTVDLSSVDEMDFRDEEVEKLRLRPGDLLVCEGGDVGRTALWKGELPLALYQNHIHRLRAKDTSVEPRLIMYWMHAAYQVFLAYQGAESRTAIPNLSGRRLKQFLAPLPPLPEQRRIVARLEVVREQVQALKKAQEDTEAHLKELERSILDKAFRGEL